MKKGSHSVMSGFIPSPRARHLSSLRGEVKRFKSESRPHEAGSATVERNSQGSFRRQPRETEWDDSQPVWVDDPQAVHPVAAGRASYQPGFDREAACKEFIRVAECDVNRKGRTLQKPCGEGELLEAAEVLDRLVQRGCYVSTSFLSWFLKRCITKKDLVTGRRIHALVVSNGCESNRFFANHIIRMYASHGSLEEASQVFSGLASPDAYSWSSIILAYTDHGQPTEAIEMYWHMRQSTVMPDNHTFVAALKACASASDLTSGRQVHADVLRRLDDPNVFIGSCLVDMYAKCGSLSDARRVFDNLVTRDVVTWNAMLTGYAQQGLGQEVLTLYASMQQEAVTLADHVTFVCLLKACGSIGAQHLAQQLHFQVKERGLERDLMISNCLIDMHARCGSLDDAREVFDRMQSRDVVTWTSMIAGYAQHGFFQEALVLYGDMQHEGMTAATRVTFICLLKACASSAALDQGKQLHAQIRGTDLETDVVVGNCLVDMYAKCGSLDDALTVFKSLPTRNVVTWNTMLTGYMQHGLGQEALCLYGSMQEEGLHAADYVTFACLLNACAHLGALDQGKQLHAQIQEREMEVDVVIGSCLVDMYVKCGSLKDARTVFDSLGTRDVVTWNTMLAGYTQHGLGQDALSLYRCMQEEDTTAADQVTFVCLLKACSTIAALHQGKQVHAQVQEKGFGADIAVGSCLVDMYAKCGSLHDARRVFDNLATKDVVTWNTMLTGYAQHGLGQEVLALYAEMQLENITPTGDIALISLLKACGSIRALDQGRQVHALVQEKALEDDVVFGSCLVDMYVKCGDLDEARKVFDNLATKDVVTWNAMLSGYAQHGLGQEALDVYAIMQHEGITSADDVTFVCLLTACASIGSLDQGKHLHARVQEKGLGAELIVGNCLVDMYSKCGSLDDARRVFDNLAVKDVITWNAMLAGYVQQGLGHEALALYVSMKDEGKTPADHITLVCLLKACASVAALRQGKQLHSEVLEMGLAADGVIGSCLVDMYAKCGSLDVARRVFDNMVTRDIVTWNAMLAGYAQHGLEQEALRCYEEMQLAGINPDGVTFLSLICLCSRAGQVDKGHEFFECMRRDHGITPEIEHFVSMLDLFGRSGCFTRMIQLLETMPMQPDLATWLCMLGACRKHGNVALGRQAFDNAVLLQPTHAASYVLMSQIYADAGLLDHAKDVEKLRKKEGVQKERGYSWIEHEHEAHSFFVGGCEHPEYSKLRDMLEKMSSKLKTAGLFPDVAGEAG